MCRRPEGVACGSRCGGVRLAAARRFLQLKPTGLRTPGNHPVLPVVLQLFPVQPLFPDLACTDQLMHVQASNAVAQARAQLQEAANSNNLEALDAAIEHGERVLSVVRSGNAPALTQSLALVSASEVAKWRHEADDAAAKVEKLQGIQARARSEANQAKHAEQEWMDKAREARSEAQKLAARRTASVDSLEEEKRKLIARLETNEAKIQRVEAVEGEAESRAAQRSAEQRAVYEREQHREIAEQRAALSEQRPLSNSDTNKLRQTYGYDSEGRKVKNLEAELQRQIGEYKEAREVVSHNSQKKKEQRKEKELMDEIQHIKHARVALMHVRETLCVWERVCLCVACIVCYYN